MIITEHIRFDLHPFFLLSTKTDVHMTPIVRDGHGVVKVIFTTPADLKLWF